MVEAVVGGQTTPGVAHAVNVVRRLSMYLAPVGAAVLRSAMDYLEDLAAIGLIPRVTSCYVTPPQGQSNES